MGQLKRSAGRNGSRWLRAGTVASLLGWTLGGSLRLLLPCSLPGAVAGAQVLARPGWAGSGVTLEPWWVHAVFYRIEVAHFQDTDGDSQGDLQGVAERLDYLQGLGVDALVLAGLPADRGGNEMDQFAELVRAATARHLRLLVELSPAATPLTDAARAWLIQGAAGVAVAQRQDGASLAALRRVTDGFPGGRILMAPRPLPADALAAGQGAQLMLGDALDPATGAVGLRSGLQQDLAPAQAAAYHRTRGVALAAARPVAVLRVVRADGTDAERAGGIARAALALALGSRGALMLEYGEELGLERATGGRPPTMQWTTSNVTPRPAMPPVAAASTPAPPAYGAFRAFVPPLPRTLFPAPRMPEVVFTDAPPPVPLALLPGFTTGPLPEASTAANAALASVAGEEAEPGSVLRMTRRLLQLRHDNSTLRSGSEQFLDYDAVGAVVWVRAAPAGSRTSGTVIGIANLTGTPVYVSLAQAGRGAARPLIAGDSSPALAPGGTVKVAAYSVFLGEFLH